MHMYTHSTECNIATTMSCILVDVLMRDEKEGRKKEERSNKSQGKETQHTQGSKCTFFFTSEL